jgi:hypothetical protein
MHMADPAAHGLRSVPPPTHRRLDEAGGCHRMRRGGLHVDMTGATQPLSSAARRGTQPAGRVAAVAPDEQVSTGCDIPGRRCTGGDPRSGATGTGRSTANRSCCVPLMDGGLLLSLR